MTCLPEANQKGPSVGWIVLCVFFSIDFPEKFRALHLLFTGPLGMNDCDCEQQQQQEEQKQWGRNCELQRDVRRLNYFCFPPSTIPRRRRRRPAAIPEQSPTKGCNLNFIWIWWWSTGRWSSYAHGNSLLHSVFVVLVFFAIEEEQRSAKKRSPTSMVMYLNIERCRRWTIPKS